jgi:hypothetical protein
VQGSIEYAAGELEVVIELDPGIYLGDPGAAPEQTLREVFVRRGGGRATFGSLTPAVLSEVLTDLTAVTA